jgi:integrase/recombinase XerD
MLGKRGWIKTDEEVRLFASQEDEIVNKGAYINLMQQLNRLAKHAKGLSIKSQSQYYNHMDQFVRFLGDDYGVKNLANFSARHVAEYIEERQSEGKSAATVKGDLCALRFFHDQYGGDTRYRFPDNKELKEKFGVSLERRSFGGVNRRWIYEEVEKMTSLALHNGRPDISQMIQLGYRQGLRIHEVVRLDRSQAERAIREGFLRVKGKGGLERDIPLRADTPRLLKSIMGPVPRGQKLFVPEGRKAHEVIQSVKSFLVTHRDKVASPTARPEGVNMTYHGLRHLYAYERYQEFLQSGMQPVQARLRVAQLIGHNRHDVTRIYLAEG